jgi:hypothetical protein
LQVYPVVLVVDDVDVTVELVDVALVEVELVDEVDVDVAIAVVVVTVVGGAVVDELVVATGFVLEVEDVVAVGPGALLLDVDVVLVELGVSCDGRVVLVVVEDALGGVVEVVVVGCGGAGHVAGAGAFRAANRRGSSRFTDLPLNIMQ